MIPCIQGDCGLFYSPGNCDSSAAAGLAVSTAGDINGDGLADILIGAPGYEYAAEAYAIFGSNAGFPARVDVGSTEGFFLTTRACSTEQTALRLKDIRPSTSYNRSVGGGDVNGDGLADIIIGHPEAGPGGRVFVLFGSVQSVPEPTLLTWLAAAGTLPWCRDRRRK